jgi:PAS domain S-box-containing protein
MIGGAQGRSSDAAAADPMGAALIASEQRFQALAEVSLQGKLVHRRFKPLFANGALALLAGLGGSADVIQQPDILGLLDEETRADPERAWQIAQRGPFAGRRLYRRHDGTLYPAELYSRPIVWNGGPAVALAIIDVSAEETAQDALRLALARAEDSERQRRHFIDATRRVLEGPAATLQERLDMLVRQATRSPNFLIERRPRVATLDILLVSEEASTRATLQLALAGLSHRPQSAHSQGEALSYLRSRRFDAVVVDLEMVAFNGLALPRAIRALPGKASATPILALGEAGIDAAREEIAEAGVDAFLGKFLDIPQLAETLRLLAGARLVDPALGNEVQQGDDDQKSDNDVNRTQGHCALHG